jgi:flagellar biosynthesis protein FlhA
MLAAVKKALGSQSDLLLVIGVVGILLVLITPIPSVILDLLLILNISLALLILLLTFYVEKPLQFSTFPSLLLIATLFRLSLNIAATRLILGDADAGKVIAAIGEHVVAGNYVVGLIVFLVLIVVQYVVVTNGAQRVAEVAARFTLDSMPGKQMSIDADMNIGIIDEKEAKRRRKEIEKEGNFYGAMDGASKFVKGDAVAGIIINHRDARRFRWLFKQRDFRAADRSSKNVAAGSRRFVGGVGATRHSDLAGAVCRRADRGAGVLRLPSPRCGAAKRHRCRTGNR